MIPLGSRRWHRALFLFTALFILAVITEFGVVWFYQYTKARRKLSWSAQELAKYLSYSERWDLKRLDRGEPKVLSYYILDINGRNLDIEQFTPAMKLRVRQDYQPPGLQPVVVKETGENWKLFVRHLQGGFVILGIHPPEDITNVDKRLKENADLFGSSLETALHRKTEDIDKYIHFAIVDDKFNLRFAIGGIPLPLERSQGLHLNRLDEVRAEDGLTYGVFTLPFRDTSGRTVGMISTFDEIDPKPWFSFLYWIVNCLSSGVLAFVGTLIGIPYIGEKFEPLRVLHDSLRKGESSTVEFKESLRWAHWQNMDQMAEELKKKLSEEIAVKTVVAFLNNQTGGTLLIGVSDDKKTVGLERDYSSLSKKGERPDEVGKKRDRFQMHFRNLLSARVGRDVSNLYIQTAIVEVDGKDVCIVQVRPASMPTYLFDGKTKSFYVRDGASTVALDVEQVVAYVKQRWPKSLWHRGWNALYR